MVLAMISLEWKGELVFWGFSPYMTMVWIINVGINASLEENIERNFFSRNLVVSITSKMFQKYLGSLGPPPMDL